MNGSEESPNVKHQCSPFLAHGGARIVGGGNATKPYPYQVSLQSPKKHTTDQYDHFCGGSIITTRHVLTAGKFLAAKCNFTRLLKHHLRICDRPLCIQRWRA